MNQNYQLCSPWCVWLGYLVTEDQSTKADYTDRLKNIHVIKTYNDLIFFWQQSKFKDVRQFFVTQADANHNNFVSFEIDGKERNISAINFFREGILPTWEDKKNQNGGRLIFQIDKQVDKYQEIYEWLIFYFLGQSEPSSEQINGIRFISHKSTTTFRFHYRVEVWTRFNNSENEKAQRFKDTFVKDFFNTFKETYAKLKKNFKPTFKNNKEDEKEKEKDKQEKDEKKDQDSKPKE